MYVQMLCQSLGTDDVSSFFTLRCDVDSNYVKKQIPNVWATSNGPVKRRLQRLIKMVYILLVFDYWIFLRDGHKRSKQPTQMGR